MKTPFKIKFRREIIGSSSKDILENFKVNFTKSYCDYVEILDETNLIVENDFIRLKPDLNFNLWVGIGRAKISIVENKDQNKKTVKYCIDFTRLTSVYIFLFVVFPFTFLIGKIRDLHVLLFISTIVISVGIIMHGITFLRHWSIFKRTILNGTEYLGDYDWKTIIKNKTNKELQDVIDGKRDLPEAISILAKKELENRKIGNESNKE